MQPVQFTRRRIVEAQSQVALVRDGKEDVLRFGDDVTISLRAELTPTVDAPLVFAGYGLSAPDAGHDDLAGLDLKGKVAVFITGTPASITGAPAAHYQNWAVRWPSLKAAGAIGAISIPNPKIMEQPWERTAPSRLNPVMTLVDPALQRSRGHEGERERQPGQRRAAVRGIRPLVRGAARARRRAETAADVRAAGDAARPRDARIDGDRVGQRRRAAAGQRSRARAASTSS